MPEEMDPPGLSKGKVVLMAVRAIALQAVTGGKERTRPR